MAEFPGKLAIFWQKSGLASRGREGGVFWKFSISGGYFGYTPLVDPCSKPNQKFVKTHFLYSQSLK